MSTLGPQLVRLPSGPTPTEGRVELYYNGSYGTICRIGWDLVDATVVSGQYCMYCPDTTKCDVLQEMICHTGFSIIPTPHSHTSSPHFFNLFPFLFTSPLTFFSSSRHSHSSDQCAGQAGGRHLPSGGESGGVLQQHLRDGV